MRTLVIHPEDETTDFLKPIYRNIKNKTVITGGMTRKKVNQQIKRHNRILMLGHGTGQGLFSMVENDEFWGYIIDDLSAKYLLNKESIFVFCHSDIYVNRHKLRGLFTGMFISEKRELEQCGMADVNQEIIDESNNLFSWVIGKNINKSTPTIFNKVKMKYQELAFYNPVAAYNYPHIYYR